MTGEMSKTVSHPLVAALEAKAEAALQARDSSNRDRRESPGMRHDSVGRAYRDAAKMAAAYQTGPFVVSIIEHRFGQTVSIHTDAAKARAGIAKWCREYWKQEMPRGRKMPASDDDVIAGYFEHMADRGESCSIHEDVPIED